MSQINSMLSDGWSLWGQQLAVCGYWCQHRDWKRKFAPEDREYNGNWEQVQENFQAK